MATTEDETPRIYVASLSDYNAGRLHGCWITIDDTTTTDDVWDQLNAMLRASKEPNAEEHAIHDFENFGGWHLREYEAIETVTTVGQFMATHQPTAVGAWLDDRGTVDPDDLARFEDDYAGAADNERAFVINLITECGWANLTGEQVSRVLKYLDLDTIERELFDGGYWSAPNPAGGVFIFTSS